MARRTDQRRRTVLQNAVAQQTSRHVVTRHATDKYDGSLHSLSDVHFVLRWRCLQLFMSLARLACSTSLIWLPIRIVADHLCRNMAARRSRRASLWTPARAQLLHVCTSHRIFAHVILSICTATYTHFNVHVSVSPFTLIVLPMLQSDLTNVRSGCNCGLLQPKQAAPLQNNQHNRVLLLPKLKHCPCDVLVARRNRPSLAP